MNESADAALAFRSVQVALSDPLVQPRGREGAPHEWGIAVEAPVELRLNGAPWSVMLASPSDLEDLAVGLALTERLAATADAVRGIHISQSGGDWTVAVSIPAPLREARARTIAGATGCGVCGLESLADLHAGMVAPSPRGAVAVVSDGAVQAAWAELPALQPLNVATRSVHAAAWCTLEGQVVLVREDVGRHNALDKLVGALARQGRLGEPGFIAMTSRCSVELVSKAAVAQASLLATISAPTTLALEVSERLGVPLACSGPGHHVVRFTVPHIAQEAVHAAE
jgi:FdhD protein